MVDTIVLTLDENMFAIIDHDRFNPSTRGLYGYKGQYYRMGGRGNIICKQNPTKKELNSGIYKPRLSVTRRFTHNKQFQVSLKVEFSAPKLLYGNNFDELVDEDFEKVVSCLQQALKGMGVLVFPDTIKKGSTVSSIHYSKNIVIDDYTTPYYYIEQLTRANINLALDTNQSDYRNEGHSFKYRNNSFEVVFYDKIKDLERAKISEKRSEEKGNSIQLNLFEKVEFEKPFEVLRCEIRLNKRQKIRQVLRKIDREDNVTFEYLFSSEIAQTVLKHFLKEIEDGFPSLLMYERGKKDLIVDLKTQYPEMGLTKILKIVGIKSILDELTIREFRQLTKSFGSHAWYPINKEIKNLDFEQNNYPVFGFINEKLDEWNTLSISDYTHMLNNDKL